MANTIDIQILQDDAKYVSAHIYLQGDGSGGLNQQILDPATFSPACAEYRIMSVHANALNGNPYTVLGWEATAIKNWFCLGATQVDYDFSDIGGLPNSAGAGKTGGLWLYSNLSVSQHIAIYLKLLKIS